MKLGSPLFAIEIKGLVKRYPLPWKNQSVLALNQLDLIVKQGEVVGLLGPNGSGKSTTLKILLGLIKPTAGSVTIEGQPPSSLQVRSRIGYLPESPHFYPFLCAEEIVRFFGKLGGMTGSPLEKKIDEVIELVSLTSERKRPLRTYSKGMLQRLGLAQALIQDPAILFLDEPTNGLDPINSRYLRDLILELKNRGKTILFSSHLLGQVQEIADRVAILHLGKKLMEGSLDELLTQKNQTQILIESLSETEKEQLCHFLKNLKKEGITISHPKQSLEELFLHTVAPPQPPFSPQ